MVATIGPGGDEPAHVLPRYSEAPVEEAAAQLTSCHRAHPHQAAQVLLLCLDLPEGALRDRGSHSRGAQLPPQQ